MKITSKIYQASCDTVRGQDRVGDYTPALRLQDGGSELAVITLSGYKVGYEMSPKDWAARFALCHNMHDDLVEAIEGAFWEYSKVMNWLAECPDFSGGGGVTRIHCYKAMERMRSSFDATLAKVRGDQ